MSALPQDPALLGYLLVAAATSAGILVVARVLRVRARKVSRLKTTTYECGEAPSGLAWVRFHARYYVLDRAKFGAAFEETADYAPLLLTPDKGRGGKDILNSGFERQVDARMQRIRRHLQIVRSTGRFCRRVPNRPALHEDNRLLAVATYSERDDLYAAAAQLGNEDLATVCR